MKVNVCDRKGLTEEGRLETTQATNLPAVDSDTFPSFVYASKRPKLFVRPEGTIVLRDIRFYVLENVLHK